MPTLRLAAAGPLLIPVVPPKDLTRVLRPGKECVIAAPHDLPRVLAACLENEPRRRAVALAAVERLKAYTPEAWWAAIQKAIDDRWPELLERAKERNARSVRPFTAWECLAGIAPAEPLLADARDHPDDPRRQAAAGLLTPDPTEALACFGRAAKLDRAHPVYALNLAEGLRDAGRQAEAKKAAADALRRLAKSSTLPPEAWDEPCVLIRDPAFGHAWDRAARDHAGDPSGEAAAKARLARARLHLTLGELTGDPAHFYEATLARPDWPPGRAALGCALARAGRLADALPHLEDAVRADPFDRPAARALGQALSDLGDQAGHAAFCARRRRLRDLAPDLVFAEGCFFLEPPADALASLIVPCHNQLDFTKECLEAVLKHTTRPYELVLIDNGSTDGTADYFASLATRPGPRRVYVVANPENRGFPAAVNQGLARARGEYLVLLNNDVVVTPGWLDRLVGWAHHDWPKVGLVGPVTNAAPPPQLAAPTYQDLSGLDAYAAARTTVFSGQALDTPRLTGFCLLIRKEALDRLGRLDEGYGLGFFDDDDLAVRARRAGYRQLVALDCYVHHHGSRTFRALGVDTERLLKENFDRFRAKWGDEEARHYSGPGLSPPPRPPARRQTVSLTMIVKDEARHLPDCLASVADLVDEVIVVDTGSADRTREVARSYGAKVFDFPWVDDFAAARNAALSHATGDWVLWLDADDRLDDESRPKLKALLASLTDENAAYAFKCHCLGTDPASATVVDHLRLFRNRPGVRWEYRVHEQILPAVRRVGGAVRAADVTVTHVGYADPAARPRKLARDLRLLELEVKDQPDDPFTLFNLGSTYRELGRNSDALPYLERSLARSHPGDSIVRKLYALIAHCRIGLGRPAEALKACEEGRKHYPADAELLYLTAGVRKELGDPAAAEELLRRLVDGPAEGAHFASVTDGLRGHKGRHALAAMYAETGRAAEAEAEWRMAVAEQPAYLPAQAALAELLLSQGRWADAEARAAELDRLGPEGEAMGAAVRGRALLVRRDYPAAWDLLSEAVGRFPRAVRLRALRSHAALRGGLDGEAERALLDVLDLTPGDMEARRNLALFRARRLVGPEGDVTLDALHRALCAAPSDIREHLPALFGLARQCRHVTEFGTGAGVFTTALLAARPGRVVSCDVARQPEVDLLLELAGPAFEFRLEEVLAADIAPTELLLIHTQHDHDQLRRNLQQHAGKVGKWIVLHGTTPPGVTPGQRGLWPVVEEFLGQGTFRLGRKDENNALAVLERV